MCLPLGIGVDNVKGHDIPIFIGIGRLAPVYKKKSEFALPLEISRPRPEF